jgi:hypothetical protein
MAIQVGSLDDFEIIERVARAIQHSPNFDLEYVLCGFPMAIRPSKVGQLWPAILARAKWIRAHRGPLVYGYDMAGPEWVGKWLEYVEKGHKKTRPDESLSG